MRQHKKPLRLLCLALSVTLLAGCSFSAEEAPAEEELLRFSACLGQAPLSLDPAESSDATTDSILLHLYENLMKLDADAQGNIALTCGMAKEYDKTLNEDGSVTYSFSLRESTHWTDGTGIRADDFVFAWQRLADPDNGFANRTLLDMVEGYDAVQETGDASKLAITAIDEHTLSVTLTYDCSYFLEEICTHPATMPLRRDLVEGYPAWGGELPVCNGAYQVSSWSSESMVLSRNPQYYEYRALSIDSLCFAFAETSEDAYALYENGEVDFVQNLPLSALEKEDLAWQEFPYAEVYTVLFQHESETFMEPLVRQAFSLAVDQSQLTELVGSSVAVADGIVPWGIADAEPDSEFRTVGGSVLAVDAEGYAERCAQAQECLKQAGYGGGSGFPVVELCYRTDTVEHLVAEALAQMWKDVLGVTVTLRNLSEEELQDEVQAGRFELAAVKLTASYADSTCFLTRWRSTAEGNWVRYYNPTYDVLIGVVEASQNDAARVAFLHDAEQMLLNDSALVPLYFYSGTYLLRENWGGIFNDALGRFYFTTLHPLSA